MLLPNIPTYNRACFTWSPRNRVLSTEASDLGVPAGQRVGGALYDDAADEGFRIVRRDGSELIVASTCNDRIDDGELVYWEFAPIDAEIQARPELAGLLIHVYND